MQKSSSSPRGALCSAALAAQRAKSPPPRVASDGQHEEAEDVPVGAILPSELLSRILNFVCEATEVERGRTGTLTKRELGRCSLVCHHWATMCRPYIFRRLTIRSREDTQAFLALVRGSEEKRDSVFHYVDQVVLEEDVGVQRQRPPWAYLLFLSEIPPVSVTLKITATSPDATFTFLSVVPRTLPSTVMRCRDVEVSECRCESFADLAMFFGALNTFMLASATCKKVTWQDSSALELFLPPPPINKPSRGIPYKGEIFVKQCVDAWPFVWLFFTTHHGHRTWKRHRVHYIDPQELTKLCNLVRFITQACIGKRGVLESEGVHKNCGEFHFELTDNTEDDNAILSVHCSRNDDVNRLHCTPGFYISISPAGLVIAIRVEYHGKHIGFGMLSRTALEAFDYPWEALDELAAEFGPTLQHLRVRIRTFEASMKAVVPAIVPRMPHMQEADKLRLLYQSHETRWDWLVYRFSPRDVEGGGLMTET